MWGGGRPDPRAVLTVGIRPQMQACGNPRALNTPLFQGAFHPPHLALFTRSLRLEIDLKISTSNYFHLAGTIHGSLQMRVLASDRRLVLMVIEGNNEELIIKVYLRPLDRFSPLASRIHDGSSYISLRWIPHQHTEPLSPHM